MLAFLAGTARRTRCRLPHRAFTAPYGSGAATDETICAVASGVGTRAAVAVLRVSGPRAFDVLHALAPETARAPPKPRNLSRCDLYAPETGRLLDRAMAVAFRGPASFTGEDVVELHTHGGRAVVRDVLEAVQAAGARLATPGEFTRRAFLHGKLDLVQAEGLADLINADTAWQRDVALRNLEGEFGRQCDAWRAEVISMAARLTAVVDFGEDERIDDDVVPGVVADLRRVAEEIRVLVQHADRGDVARDGLRLAIVGPTNGGKSTMMNFLTRRAVALVSDVPGTTRDSIESLLDMDGYPVRLTDTAGIRSQTDDALERAGMDLARRHRQDAQVTLVVVDAHDAAAAAEYLADSAGEAIDEAVAARTILVVNKCDDGRVPDSAADIEAMFGTRAAHVLHVSLHTSFNTAAVSSTIHERVRDVLEPMTESTLATRGRFVRHLDDCLGHMDAALATMGDLELAAEELRLATEALGAVTGRVVHDEVLEVLFSQFCIGK